MGETRLRQGYSVRRTLVIGPWSHKLGGARCCANAGNTTTGCQWHYHPATDLQLVLGAFVAETARNSSRGAYRVIVNDERVFKQRGGRAESTVLYWTKGQFRVRFRGVIILDRLPPMAKERQNTVGACTNASFTTALEEIWLGK